MPDPSLEKLQNQCLAYGLAADDMSQAIAAAITLRDEEGNRNLDRALECAMTICYMRAFTSKLLTVSGKFVPSTDRGYSAQDVELHEWFEEHRDKAYAHTDEHSGRMATVIPLDDGSGGAAWSLIWDPFPREWINPAIRLFDRQRESYRAKALQLHEQIKALGGRGSGALEQDPPESPEKENPA